MTLPAADPPAVSRAAALASGAGTALKIVAGQLLRRSLPWFPLGLAAGLLAAGLAYGFGTLPPTGSGLAGRLLQLSLILLLPLLGLVLFGLHGLNRGAAHAALALEAQWGLVAQAVDGVLGLIRQRLGTQLANLPLAQIEAALKQAVRSYLGDEESGGRRGLSGWMLRKARRLVVRNVELVLLSAFRAQLSGKDGGGGIDLHKVRDQVIEQAGGHLREFLLGPLTPQLVLLLVLFFGLGVGGYPLLRGLYQLGANGVAMFS
jgi:hypothetical protein